MNGRLTRVSFIGTQRSALCSVKGTVSVWAWISLALLLGCAHPYYQRSNRPHPMTDGAPPVVKPVVAVTDFENRANFSGQWNLGGGMAEIMIERLMHSDEVIILERQHIDGVLAEIQRQALDLFRREGRAERGRLKNARYLIRGVVTDFTVTGDASGWFSSMGAKGRFRSARSRVGLYVTVSDVETGQIISAVRTEGTASSGGFSAHVDYKKVTFGGDAYFRTPLGRATRTAMERAVAQILGDIPRDRWRPRVAESGINRVIINGGENVGVKVGQRFKVRREGRIVTDPITGDVLERVPGAVVGTLEIKQVGPVSAHADLVDGEASRGDFLEGLH